MFDATAHLAEDGGPADAEVQINSSKRPLHSFTPCSGFETPFWCGDV
jgi:hypothetical protein